MRVLHSVLFKMLFTRNKLIMFSSIMIGVYLYLFYSLVMTGPSETHISSVKLPYVIVHLDLKGAPLKLNYLESLLPMLKQHGANGLLIEYEDMFPYEGKLVNISAKNCYGKKQLKTFLKAAVKLNFEVIPLIQTFGHMEHVLKLQEFMHLREIPEYPDSICPSKFESRMLITHMLEQVINFHFSVIPLKYIHIGCDEVLSMGKCQQCRKDIQAISDIEFFAAHVRFVAAVVTKLSPNTTILIWDDMLRDPNPTEFKNMEPFSNIEPVYWHYEQDSISDLSLFNYHRKFKNIWIASAFKGADGNVASVPILQKRLGNHFTWMNHILNYKFGGEKNVYEFKGIILTGWSRYSHFDPLCELFPVAIPSLVANLLLIEKFRKGFWSDKSTSDLNGFDRRYGLELWKKFTQSLKCEKGEAPNTVFLTNEFPAGLTNCNFESRDLFIIMHNYVTLQSNIEKRMINNKGYFEYYAKAKFVKVQQQETFLSEFNETLLDLYVFDKMLIKIMANYYSDNVIHEYINFKTYSLKKYVKNHIKLLTSIESKRVWERNPFNSNI